MNAHNGARQEPRPVRSQFPALVRHFFGRFFDNEFVAQNTDMEVTVTKILALLASPGLLLPFFRYRTYLALDQVPPIERLPTLWFDRCFFLSFAMLVMGGVTIIEWDALFPDRRDYVSLIPLPIRSRTIFLAKIGALVLFLLGFTASVNAASSVLFPMMSYRLLDYHGGVALQTILGFRGLARTILSQATAVLAASAFVFLFLVALEGVLLNILSVRWFRKASVYVQCGTVFALLSLFFLFPEIAGQIGPLKARHALELYAFPPAWFLGLNEVLLGSRDPAFFALAHIAEAALAAATLVSVLSYSVAYRRHVRRTLESIEGSEGVRTQMHEWTGALADILVPDSLERATVAFIGKTLARSAKHRIFLAAYIGVGCAFVLQALAGSGMRQAWLSVPLVLSFFILSGMRYVFTIPFELPANWLFRVTETDARRHSLDGSRRAMFWFGVAPLFAALAPFYFFLWSPPIATAHLAFSITISILLIEALLLDFWKIPFTCSYPSGKANVTLLWIFYWVAFTTYAYSMATLEAWMVLRPMRLLAFYATAALLFLASERNRERWTRIGFTLIFEDAADPVVRTLGLSELAWRARKPGLRTPSISRNLKA
jgi:hypothetical protein